MTEMEDSQSLTVERDPAGVIVVHGDIDVAGGPILEVALVDDENDNSQVVIDLGDVSFIDSSGLRCLLGASRRARDRGTTVVLRHVGQGSDAAAADHRNDRTVLDRGCPWLTR